MSTRIGIAVGVAEVRAVLVKHGRVQWADSCAVHTALEPALDEVLAGMPLGRWKRPPVHVAIGPSFAQLRRLHGLPDGDRPTLERIVRESATRFFLRNGVPISTSSVRRDADGAVWAAAFDDPALRDVENACARRGLSVRRFLPSAAALGHVPHEPRVRWRDGDAVLEASFDGGRLVEMRRLPELDGEMDSTTFPQDALGAVLAPSDEISLTPRERPAATRRRFIGAVSVLISGLMAALAAPSIAAARASNLAAAELRAVAPRRIASIALASELERLRSNAAVVSALRAPSALGDLAALTAALPTELALISYRADSSALVVGIIGSAVSSVLADLDSVPGFAAPEMVGAVTRDPGRANAATLERATVRLRRVRGAR